MNRYSSERRTSGIDVGPSGEPTIIRIPRSQRVDPRDRETDRNYQERPRRPRRPREYSTDSEGYSSEGTRRPSLRRRRTHTRRRPHPDERPRSIADSPLRVQRSISHSDDEYGPRRAPPTRLVSRSPTRILSRAQSSTGGSPGLTRRILSPQLPPHRVQPSPTDVPYTPRVEFPPPPPGHPIPLPLDEGVPQISRRSQATTGGPSQRGPSGGKTNPLR